MDQHHSVDVPHGPGEVRVRLCNHGIKGVIWPTVRPPAVACADCTAIMDRAYPPPTPAPRLTAWQRLTGARPLRIF